MSFTERHIIETYSILFNGLSSLSKIELIESLTKSLKKDKMEKADTFYKAFGAFSKEKTAEEIVIEIKSSRKFKNREIRF
jgi:4-hydroxyphenylpyruvate dioxygenase-like putative hemolysin